MIIFIFSIPLIYILYIKNQCLMYEMWIICCWIVLLFSLQMEKLQIECVLIVNLPSLEKTCNSSLCWGWRIVSFKIIFNYVCICRSEYLLFERWENKKEIPGGFYGSADSPTIALLQDDNVKGVFTWQNIILQMSSRTWTKTSLQKRQSLTLSRSRATNIGFARCVA